MEKHNSPPEIPIQEFHNYIQEIQDQTAILRLRQVYQVLSPLVNEEKPLPPGTTPLILRFLIETAKIPNLWQQMDDKDPRLGDVLLGYYGEGLTTVQLVAKVSGITDAGKAGRYLNRALVWLWENMPEKSVEFTIDKKLEFPLAHLQGTRNERRKAAAKLKALGNQTSDWGREQAMKRWGYDTNHNS